MVKERSSQTFKDKQIIQRKSIHLSTDIYPSHTRPPIPRQTKILQKTSHISLRVSSIFPDDRIYPYSNHFSQPISRDQAFHTNDVKLKMNKQTPHTKPLEKLLAMNPPRKRQYQASVNWRHGYTKRETSSWIAVSLCSFWRKSTDK